MKNLIFFFLFCGTILNINAQQAPIMVCDPAGVNCAPFYNLDAAINAANPNDYVYIPGGGWTISVVITKPLKIIGAGFHIDSSQTTGVTMLNGNIYFSGVNTTGTVLEGFYLTGSIGSQDGNPFKNFLIRRVNIDNTHPAYPGYGNQWTPMENCLISQCIIRHSIYGAFTAQGNTIENSIIGSIYGVSNTTIRNCVFIQNPNTGTSISYGRIENSTIKNCVFLSGVGSNDGNLYNTGILFKNNLILVDNPGNIPGFTSTINCIYDVSGCPNHFNHCPVIENNPYNYNEILYQLKSNSSAKNAGDDGTDIGIFGGSNPWKMGAIPSNPHIYYSNIPGSTNNIGSLPVQVKVRTEN